MGFAACSQGKRVRCYTTTGLVTQLLEAREERTVQRVLKQLDLHRSGLIHRDVKPSNIIFVNGVAKLADIGLVTDLSEAQSFVGTEGFIPPEGPNSSQADIYALGKVLYEASMGKDRQDFPEPRSGLGLDADSRALMEFNTVLLRACAPNPKERYQSAEEMNADLALLHSGQSVKDKHALERRLKITRRVAVATAAVLVLAVVPYYVAIKEMRLATAAAREEAAARQSAQEQSRQAKEAEAQTRTILEFFQKHVLALARPKGEPNALSRDVTVREALVEAEKRIPAAFTNQPLVEAQLRATLGETFWYLGDAEKAIAQGERATELFRAKLGLKRKETLAAMNDLTMAYENNGQFGKALPLAQQTVAGLTELQGKHSRETHIAMHSLAFLYHTMGRDPEALPLERETLELRKTVLGAADSDTLSSMDSLAMIYRSLGLASNAISLGEETVAISRKNLGLSDPNTLTAMGNLASSYQDAGQINKALPLLKEVAERRKIIYGPDAPATLISLNNLASAYLMNGETKEAIKLHEETLRLRRLKLRPDHPDLFASMQNLASAYAADGRLAEAIAMAEATVAGRQKIYGPDHPATLQSMSSLAADYQDNRQFSNAVQMAEKVFSLAETKLGREHPVTLKYLHALAAAYKAAGQESNALPRFQEALKAEAEQKATTKKP